MKKLKENIAIISALVALLLAGLGSVGGAILYAESTYYKTTQAQQQFQDLRLDGLYRTVRELDTLKKKEKRELTEFEQEEYNRAVQAIKDLKEGKKK